jgi:ABC-type Zn uptake system ZnuABC Zn-binding protein ZnuA
MLTSEEEKIKYIEKDPHIWMSPKKSIEIAKYVKDFLV